MGEEYTLSHAACLCAQLPADSRTVKTLLTDEQSEALLWTLPVRIAAEQLNELRLVRWLSSQDAVDERNRPEPLLPPEARDAERPVADGAGYRAAIAEIRERIRETNGGDELCQEQ